MKSSPFAPVCAAQRLPLHARLSARRRLFPLSLLTLACLPVAAAADEAPDDTVVVTAARMAQPLPDALPSTTVLTRDDIDAMQAADLPDLLRMMTSIDIAQSGPLGSQTSLFLRGADSRQVLVLIDGVPYSRADFRTPSWQHIAPDQIERVEIVRGNLSSLYGAQAIGGVVQIVTRQAQGVQASVGAGSRGSVSVAGSAGTRWGEGERSTALSASLSHDSTDGYSARNPATSPGANPDRDPARQTAATVRVEQAWAPGQRTLVSLLSTRTVSAYDGFTPGLDDVLSTQLDNVALQSHHALGAGLELGLQWGHNHERYTDPTGFATSGDNRSDSAGVQLQWQPGAGQTFQVGVDDKRDRYIESDLSSACTPHEQGGRIGWVGRFGPEVGGTELQANWRHDKTSAFGSADTGLLALAWRLAPGWKLGGQVSTAFSAPSCVDQQYAPPGVMLRPEHSRDGEINLHWQGGGWAAAATYFVQQQRDRIDFDPVTFASENIARSRNQGLELSADGALGAGRLGMEATFQNPRNLSAGTLLKRRAKASVAAHYRVPLAGWETGAWLRFTGPRLDTDPATFANADNPARTTLSLTADRPLATDWKLGLRLDNATDSRTPEILGYTPPPRSVSVQLQGQWK